MTPTGLKQRGRLVREPCGCAHDGAQWIEECDKHHEENAAIHAAALARVSYEPKTVNAWE